MPENHLFMATRRAQVVLRWGEVNKFHCLTCSALFKTVLPKAPLGFEPRISCLLDRRFHQLSHGASHSRLLLPNIIWSSHFPGSPMHFSRTWDQHDNLRTISYFSRVLSTLLLSLVWNCTDVYMLSQDKKNLLDLWTLEINSQIVWLLHLPMGDANTSPSRICKRKTMVLISLET